MNSLRLDALRSQIGVIRALTDEIEFRLPRGEIAPQLSDQLVEELARLGCEILEGAATLARAVDARNALARSVSYCRDDQECHSEMDSEDDRSRVAGHRAAE